MSEGATTMVLFEAYYLDTCIRLPRLRHVRLIGKAADKESYSTTGYIGFPIGNIQLVKVYVGLSLASLVV
jgi:hypothetical protein